MITHKDGHREVVAEYGKGDLVGIVSNLLPVDVFPTGTATRRPNEVLQLCSCCYVIVTCWVVTGRAADTD